MRKVKYICYATLIMLLSGMWISCSNTFSDNEPEATSDFPMRFGVANVQTRALVSNSTFTTDGTEFNVWGTYHSAKGDYPVHTLFDQTTVTRNDGIWTYDNLQYWFPGFTYNFRALYPVEGIHVRFNPANGNNSYLEITDFDVKENIDLLAAIYTKECQSGVKPGRVDFNFCHLLSRVVFVGRSDETHLGKGRQIVIDEAKLYGLSTTGSWSGENFTTATPGTWTPGALAGNANTPYSIDKSTHGKGLTLPTDGTNIFTNELFIPQKLTTNCILEITFHYNVEIGTAQSFKATVNLSTLTPKWEAGKSYRYPFTVSNHIFFEKPTIDQWQDAPVNDQAFNIYPTN